MNKKIILGITGSIAAYKAIDLAKNLQENAYDVTIVLSKSAEEFISVLTLKSLFPKRVFTANDMLDENDQMLHITLAKAADIILIAPTSANMLAKLAHGIADCLLSTICLATNGKILLAPAMNKVMWENKLVQKNTSALQEAGFYIIGPSHGYQACGDIGFGRMVEGNEIIEYCENLSQPKILEGKKIVITAGPTRESIDGVRFLSNYSSGKMGYAIARSAYNMNAEVVLITGPTSIPEPKHITTIKVNNCEEMLQASMAEAINADIFIGCAAVADFRPKESYKQKIKKSSTLTLELIKNPDIISSIKQTYSKVFCVGFAAETNNIEEYGRTKLSEKNLDMIAINDVSNMKVFGHDENELHVVTQDQKLHFLKQNHKRIIATQLLTLISNYLI